MTGQRARSIGTSGGLVGALIGGAIGASSEGPGFERFKAAASKHPVNMSNLVRGTIEQALQTSKMFELVKGSADATMRIEVLIYGVAPTNGRDLGGIIAARAELVSRDGKSLWHRAESGVSQTSAPLESYEATPSLWSRVAEKAATDLARKLILYTSADERTVSPISL